MDMKLKASLGANAVLASLALLLASCNASSGAAVLQAISLTECEIGMVSIKGEIKTGIPPFQASAFYDYQEEHTAETLPAHCGGAE